LRTSEKHFCKNLRKPSANMRASCSFARVVANCVGEGGSLPVTCGRVAHSQELLQTVSAKAALAQTTNAVVADMESAAIARYATELGVPFGAIRVVSDAVDTALPSYLSRTQTKEGFIDTRKLLALALVHPHEWSVFYQMARGGIAAQKTLQRAASLLVEV